MHPDTIKSLILSLRPHQWVKNLFVLAALVFSQNLFNCADVFKSLAVLFAFCLISSTVYLLNDITDLSADRQHPFKKNRPLAAGQLTIKDARLASFFLGFSALMIAASINQSVLSIIVIYLLLNILYSLWLKTIPFISLLVVALGFVLRAIAGAKAISVFISPWLLLCTFLVSWLLVSGKRLMEQSTANNGQRYQPPWLKTSFIIAFGITIIIYILYTIDPATILRLKTSRLWLSAPFVVIGLLQYGLLALGEKPQALLADNPLSNRFVLLSVLGWIAAVLSIIYAKP